VKRNLDLERNGGALSRELPKTVNGRRRPGTGPEKNGPERRIRPYGINRLRKGPYKGLRVPVRNKFHP